MRINEITELPARYGEIPTPKFMSRINPDDQEANAIHWYREHGYSPINAKLRGYDPKWPQGDMLTDYGFEMSIEDAIRHLDAITKKYQRAQTIRVFRGEENIEHAKKLSNIPVGDSYVDHGFCSTTFDPTRAFYAFAQTSKTPHNILSMFIVPSEVRGASLFMSSDERDVEKEFLIARNCRYTKIDQREIPISNPNLPLKSIQLLVWNVGNID